MLFFIAKLQPIWIPRPVEYQIAFYTGLSKSIENKPVNKNCQLIFESVMLNLGNGYDNTTGIFTVPVSGVYIFVVVISAQSYEKVSGLFNDLVFHFYINLTIDNLDIVKNVKIVN